MSDSHDMERARQRAAVVFRVRSGQITVEEGARLLGVSRKTYYEWESRALQAMTEAMEDRAPGRPTSPQDEEKQQLHSEIAELRKQVFVLQKTLEVRDMLHAYEMKQVGGGSIPGKPREKKRHQRRRA